MILTFCVFGGSIFLRKEKGDIMDKNLVDIVQVFLDKCYETSKKNINGQVTCENLNFEVENIRNHSEVLFDIKKSVVENKMSFTDHGFALVKYINALAKAYVLFKMKNEQEVDFTNKSLQKQDYKSYLTKDERLKLMSKNLEIHSHYLQNISEMVNNYDKVTSQAFGEKFASLELMDKIVNKELNSSIKILKDFIVAPLRNVNFDEMDNYFIVLEAIKQEIYESVQLANALIKAEKTLVNDKLEKFEPKFVLMDGIKSTAVLKINGAEKFSKDMDLIIKELNSKIRNNKKLDLICEGDWHQHDEIQLVFNGDKKEFLKVCHNVFCKHGYAVRLTIDDGIIYNLNKEFDSFKIISQAGITARNNLETKTNMYEINKDNSGEIIYYDNQHQIHKSKTTEKEFSL